MSPQIIVAGRPHFTLWRYFHHSFCNGNDDIYYLGQKDNVKFDNSNGLHYCCIMYSKTLLLGQAFNSTQIVPGQFLISTFDPHSCAWWRNTCLSQLRFDILHRQGSRAHSVSGPGLILGRCVFFFAVKLQKRFETMDLSHMNGR